MENGPKAEIRSGPGKPNQRKVGSRTFRGGIPEQKFNMNRACFPKEMHQNSQKWAKFMNFSFWPFLWFGLPGRLLMKMGKKWPKKTKKMGGSPLGPWAISVFQRFLPVFSFWPIFHSIHLRAATLHKRGVKLFSVFLCQRCREIWREILARFFMLHFPGFGRPRADFTKISRQKRCEKRKISRKFHSAGARHWSLPGGLTRKTWPARRVYGGAGGTRGRAGPGVGWRCSSCGRS